MSVPLVAPDLNKPDARDSSEARKLAWQYYYINKELTQLVIYMRSGAFFSRHNAVLEAVGEVLLGGVVDFAKRVERGRENLNCRLLS
jgi:hypothetical protein